MPTVITICETCKRAGWNPEIQPQTDGEILAGLIESAAAGHDTVRTRRHPCLLGCDYACNISLQAPGKLTFVLGMFEPGEDAAAAIVEYAALHAASQSGYVPFREWPQGVKGHFRARLPVLPDGAE